jgi:hypothetical protein
MAKRKEILESLWLLKGECIDAEYFSYVLLAAAQKYKKDLESGNLSHFYELLFHSLNLNTLAVEGNLFDFKMNPVWKEERIRKIKSDLKKIYEDSTSETVEIFRNANYVFLSLLIEYMEAQRYFLENMEIFFVNPKIHQQKEVYIITNCMGTKRYTIWQLVHDKKKDFGFSFKKIKTLRVTLSDTNTLKQEIAEQNIESLAGMKEKENVIFAILEDKEEHASANVIKDLILLNRAISRDFPLDANLIAEIQGLLMAERVMPFNLNQWL